MLINDSDIERGSRYIRMKVVIYRIKAWTQEAVIIKVYEVKPLVHDMLFRESPEDTQHTKR